MEKRKIYAAPRINEIIISGKQVMITTSVPYDDDPATGGDDVGAKKNDWGEEEEEDDDSPYNEDSVTYSIW